MSLLITGGAGYIGSHMIKICVDAGYNVTVLDNLTNGHKEKVDGKANLIIGDVEDSSLISKIIKEHNIKAVMHFAAFIEAGESVVNPDKYYYNNTTKTISLINSLLENDVNYFIFSSTAAIFGEAKYLPIDENHPKNPINPYGKSKLMVEEFLQDVGRINKNFKYGCLRYFNASGADYKNNLGEDHNPETHLIPLLMQFCSGRKRDFYVYGNDYNTKDGTCVRDYIHVLDICDAHLKLLHYLEKNGSEKHFNLGSENGHSVLEIIKTAEKIINKKLDIKYSQRRAGDPEKLIAGNKKAKEILNWKTQYSNLENIIHSAWQWEQIKIKEQN